jgi:hypothetical protein
MSTEFESTDTTNNIVVEFLELCKVDGYEGNSEGARELLKFVREMNFSRSRGTDYINNLFLEAEALMGSRIKKLYKYQTLLWMAGAFEKSDPRFEVITGMAQKLFQDLAVLEDGGSGIASGSNDEGLEREFFSVREAVDSAEKVVPESKESLEEPIVVQDDDHLDPSIRLFSMLDSNPGLAKVVESLLKSQSSSPKESQDNSSANVLLLEVLKLALSKGSDNNSHSDDVRKPKKEIPKFGSDDSVMGFFSFFRSHAVSSWKVPESSNEFVSYFESAIQGDKNLRKEY